MTRYFITILCFLTFVGTTISQNIGEQQIKAEIEKRGLTEGEVSQALLEKGIDVNSLDLNNPSELLKYEKTIREAIVELEQKKKSENKPISEPTQVIETNGSTAANADLIKTAKDEEIKKIVTQNSEIAQAVEDGATIEEAIAEELTDIQAETAPNTNIYGQHIFKDNSIKLYRTTEEAKAPDTYQLGAGDQISISIWGETEANFKLEVTADGYIKPDRIQRIYVAGLTIKDAKEIIYRKLRNYYYFQPSQIDLNLVTARTITVNIVGEVFSQGSFTISAVNTALNALIASGGPTNIGSVRKIKILRSGEKEKTLDVYKYLQNPLTKEDFYLQDNDYIIVPISEKVVNVSGGVKRPQSYELLPSENLNKLVEYAGGLNLMAYKKNIQITRIENDKVRKLDIDYEEILSQNRDYTLVNGDKVSFRAIPEIIENVVSISGAVYNPGQYELKDNMKISDLIDLSILRENAITDTIFVERINPDQKTRSYLKVNLTDALANVNGEKNILLKKGDRVSIYEESRYKDVYSVQINGPLRFPGAFSLDYEGELTVNDLVFLAGGLKKEASNIAYIFRENDAKVGGIEYIYFDIFNAVNDKFSSDNLKLKPNDNVRIIGNGLFYEDAYISVSGAVKNPGEFLYDESVNIRDIVILAGGLKREAAPYRIDVFRINFDDKKKTQTLVANIKIDENFEVEGKDFKLSPYDQIIVRTAPEFELQQNVTVSGEAVYPGSYALLKDNSTISDLIRQCGGVTDEAFLGGATLYRAEDGIGYIIINLDDILSNKNSKFDVILKKGDKLDIPKRNTLVSIKGATKANLNYSSKLLNQGGFNVAFEKGKNAKYYINEYAGGFADNADRSNVTITKPTGKIERTKRFLFWRIYPEVTEGSVVNVPAKATKLDKIEGEKERKDIDWGEVLADSIAQATTILSLVLLLRNIN
jgi:protein involved in polysaccharide export with SLBB domain